MSKVQNMANAIFNYVRASMRVSGEIHERFKNSGPLVVTAALRLLIDDKRVERERVKGRKGFLYKITPVAAKPTVEQQIADIKAQKAAAVKKGPVETAADEFKPAFVAKFDEQKRKWEFAKAGEAVSVGGLDAVAWGVEVPSADEGFDEWWEKQGPFSNHLWLNAPKSVDLAKYMATYRLYARDAWMSAAKHFCPLSEVGDKWIKPQ